MNGAYDDTKFLLPTSLSRELYHAYAEKQPIVDYHCHLSPEAILADKPFENLGQVWLGGDHYKWRAMRLAGVPEHLVTGTASDWEKFEAFAGVCEAMCGAPVHHWAQMELHTYFDIDLPLNRKNARAIFDEAGRVMRDRGYSPRAMIRRADVRMLATTDDPVSDLAAHRSLNALPEGEFSCRVQPSFRPDPALKLADAGYADWVFALSESVGHSVKNYADLLCALEERLAFFERLGTVISDQVVEYKGYLLSSPDEADHAMRRKLRGESLSDAEVLGYYWRLLTDLAGIYHRHGFVMQLHIGAYRNVNTRLRPIAGRDSGFDIMWDAPVAEELTTFLDSVDRCGELPRTILYPLNSKDFEVLAASAASFPEEGVLGKVQLGAAWWHNDHKEGIRAQLTAISQQGLLPYFVGMLTDSRSFLSYARHDYFRRILCTFVAERIENAEFIADMDTVGELIAGISYENAKNWFCR